MGCRSARPWGLLIAALLIASLGWPAAVTAHDGRTRLVVERGSVNPGGTIVVRGEDFDADDVVKVALVGGSSLDLGDVMTDAEGHFEIGIVVPTDMAAGVYSLTAVVRGGPGATIEISVQGAPVVGEEGGQGGRDEDDPLLVALPEGWQQSLSSPNAGPPVASQDLTAGTSDAVPYVPGGLVGLVVIALGLGVFGLGRLAVRRLVRP